MTFYGLYNNNIVHAFETKQSRDKWASENHKHAPATTKDPLVRRAITVDRENRPAEYGGIHWHK